jgi:hypothetical protein
MREIAGVLSLSSQFPGNSRNIGHVHASVSSRFTTFPMGSRGYRTASRRAGTAEDEERLLPLIEAHLFGT